MKIKVKQLLVKLTKFPKIKYESKIKEIDLYEDEFHFFVEDEEEIYVESESGGLIYFVELFLPQETQECKLLELEKKIKEKMILHFEEKKLYFDDLINEIKNNG